MLIYIINIKINIFKIINIKINILKIYHNYKFQIMKNIKY